MAEPTPGRMLADAMRRYGHGPELALALARILEQAAAIMDDEEGAALPVETGVSGSDFLARLIGPAGGDAS